MGLKERLLLFIEYKGLNKGSFERMANLSNGFVDKAGDNTRTSTIDRISNCFPELNTVWLRTGEGEMLLSKESSQNDFVQASSNDVSISREAWEMIKLQIETINNQQQAILSQQQTIDYLTKKGGTAETA